MIRVGFVFTALAAAVLVACGSGGQTAAPATGESKSSRLADAAASDMADAPVPRQTNPKQVTTNSRPSAGPVVETTIAPTATRREVRSLLRSLLRPNRHGARTVNQPRGTGLPALQRLTSSVTTEPDSARGDDTNAPETGVLAVAGRRLRQGSP